MAYTRVLNRCGLGVHSPLDRMWQVVRIESRGIMRTDWPAQERGRELLNGQRLLQCNQLLPTVVGLGSVLSTPGPV